MEIILGLLAMIGGLLVLGYLLFVAGTIFVVGLLAIYGLWSCTLLFQGNFLAGIGALVFGVVAVFMVLGHGGEALQLLRKSIR
jgi:hypothetical protein